MDGCSGRKPGLYRQCIRMSARYGNLATLEDGYGINLLPLATFALETYENTSEAFTIKYNTDYNTKDLGLDMKMHKAIAVLQFKLEGQIIKRRPEFHDGRQTASG